MTALTYAGIGSRQTPPTILAMMTDIGSRLAQLGWTLHSGHAQGADQAFERGCDDELGQKRIWLPRDAQWDAVFLASHFHPAWDRCSSWARMAHGRNANIVLGDDLMSPVRMVICWTPEATGSGGTGQAIRIARHYHIPVFDLGDAATYERLATWLGWRD